MDEHVIVLSLNPDGVMMMKRILMLATVVLLLALGAGTALAQSGYDLFQKALVKERAVGDVEEALRLYQRIVKEFAGNHALAAKAQLRMGLLYERLGRKADAQRAYQAVVSQYADQTNEARQARAKIVVAPVRMRLAALGTRRSTSPADLSYHVAWKPPGRRTYPSKVSPDGRYISYENVDQGDDLFLHDLVTGADRRLTKAANKEAAEGESAFSRDSKQLAYGWTNNQGFDELQVIDLQGSGIPQPRRLFVDKDINYLQPLDWTPDGKWILVEVSRQDKTDQIALISTGDGSLRLLKSFAPSIVPFGHTICLSPDAKYVAFYLRDRGAPAGDILVLAIDGRQEIPAVVKKSAKLVGWSPDGTRLLFTSDRTGSNSLFALPVSDGRPQGEPELINADIGQLSNLGLTTSGSLYSFERGGANSDLKIASFDFSTGEILSPPTDLVVQYFAGSNRSPDWSPDGKSLAYVVEHGSRAGEFSLAIRSLETDQVQELRPQLGRVDWLRWTPDGGSFVVSGIDLKGVSGLWRVDRTTAEVSAIAPGIFTPRTYDWPGLENRFHGWSPDGRKIYYQRSLPSSRAVIRFEPRVEPRYLGQTSLPGDQGIVLFERDLASGLERELFRQTTPGPWYSPSLSADGKKLCYRKGKGVASEPSALQATFIERDLASGTEKELIRGNLGFPALSPDGRYIATSTADFSTKSRSIVLVPVAVGEARVLMQVALPQSLSGIPNLNALNALSVLWAPDSRSLVFFTFGHQAKPMPQELWWVSVDGREPPKRLSLDGQLWDVRVHPDGRRIAIAVQQPPRPAEVWVRENFLPKAARKATASRR
jgi:Tol biopolymer transport system component